MFFTVNEAAAEIQKQYGGELVPEHTMRRVVDALISLKKIKDHRTHTRARLIDPKKLKIVAAELQKRGLVPVLAAAS